jgi:hypothetical protein
MATPGFIMWSDAYQPSFVFLDELLTGADGADVNWQKLPSSKWLAAMLC